MTVPSKKSLRVLLDGLCVEQGFCLPPQDYETLIATPPTDPDELARRIFEAEGLREGDVPLSLWRSIRNRCREVYLR